MKDSLFNENSFIVDRNWQKINPTNQLRLPLQKAIDFILIMYQEHQQLKSGSESAEPRPNMLQLQNKVHNFVLKYIQQRELSSLKNKEAPFVKESEQTFDLRDCLEVWRWLNEDMVSSQNTQHLHQQSLNLNEFQVEKHSDGTSSKLVEVGEKGKKQFFQLSLEQQEEVMKKSLEMLFMYKYQLKIIFTHYCRFVIENQHKRTFTFDDVAPSLQNLNLNRFMHFCRDFDLLKLVEFKRKAEHNHKISKQTLTTIFKKTAYLQKLLNFDGFLISLVNIAFKIHQNFDARSYIQIQLLLTNLQVKYYHDFINKLESLNIKYSPTDFYNCYKDIILKSKLKKKKGEKLKMQSVHNDYPSQFKDSVSELKDIRSHSQHVESNHMDNISSLTKIDSQLLLSKNKKPKQLNKRKSLPILPSIADNKFFKPIEHHNHQNSYSKYLKQAGQSSSVFKNRITGYSNINELQKSKKPFHMSQNPEFISKESLRDIITDARTKIGGNQRNGQIMKPTVQSSSLFHSRNLQEEEQMKNESYIRQAEKELLDGLGSKEMAKTASLAPTFSKQQVQAEKIGKVA